MKKITLLKLTPDVQAGHIYEHIFCTQITEYFRSNGLYAYLDYHIDGKTFYSGYVRIEISLYTARARRFGSKITKFKISIGEDEIDGAILQVMAEKIENFTVLDSQALNKLLDSYEAQPWKQLESIETMVLKPVGASSVIHQAPRNDRNFLRSKLTIMLDHTKSSLPDAVQKPLFAVLSKIFLHNLQLLIADYTYCYSYDDYTGKKKNGNLTATNAFRIDKRQATSLTIEREVTETLIREMRAHGLVDSVYSFLQHATYTEPSLAPDDGDVTKSAAMIIGPKAWKRIATKANIEDVLNALSFEFKLGSTADRFDVDAL